MSDETIAAVTELLYDYFNSFTEVGPPHVKTYVGTYEAYYPDDPKKRKKVTHDGEARAMEYRFHATVIPVEWVKSLDFDADEIKWFVDEDKLRAELGSKKAYEIHLRQGKRAGDAVYDDDGELRASLFPYYISLAAMSKSARRQYSKDLGEIKELPSELDRDLDGHQFIKALAETCSYDADGKYFRKWKSGKENKYPAYPNLTAEYLRQMDREIELQKGFAFVMHRSDVGDYVYKLTYDDDGKLHRSHYAGGTDLRLEEEQEKKRDGKPDDVPDEVIFMMAVDGIKDPWRPKYKIAKVDHAATFRLADPVKMVETAYGGKAKTSLKLASDFDWFVEMVSLYFPDPFTVIDTEPFLKEGTFLGADTVRKDIRDYLAAPIKEAKDAKSAVAAKFAKETLALLEDNKKYPWIWVLPRGYQVWEHTLFVGADENFAYLWHTEKQLCGKSPLQAFCRDLAVVSISRVIYENTKGMIPFIMFVVWGGVAVVGLAVIGPAVVYHYVRRQITKQVTKKALWEIFKKLAPALAAALADFVLYVFDGSPRWRAFARGFFKGYVFQGIWNHYVERVLKTVTTLPAEIRFVLAMKKIRHVVDELQEKIAFFERELDADAIKKGAQNFRDAMTHLFRGMSLLLTGFYYVPHEDAKVVHAIFGASYEKDGGPPKSDEWIAEASQQLAAMIDATAEELLHLSDVKNVLGTTKKVAGVLMASVLPLVIWQGLSVMKQTKWTDIRHTFEDLPGEKEEREKAKKTRRNKKIRRTLLIIAFSAIVLIGVEVGSEKAGGAIDATVDTIETLLWQAIKDFPGDDPERAEIYGRLCGYLVSGIMLDSALFNDNPHLKNLFDTPVFGKHAKRTLKHGLFGNIMSILLRRYIALYEELVKKGILGARDGEGIFAEVLSDVRDKELEARGLGDLKKFKESKSAKAMTLRDVGMALIRLRSILDKDTEDFFKKKYGDDIKKYKNDLEAFRELVKTSGIDKWAAENAPMAYHFMQTHLRAAVHELSESVKFLFAEFSNNGFSWMQILEHLGLDFGDLTELQDEITNALKTELKGFQKS
jgi:hypothetical protein